MVLVEVAGVVVMEDGLCKYCNWDLVWKTLHCPCTCYDRGSRKAYCHSLRLRCMHHDNSLCLLVEAMVARMVMVVAMAEHFGSCTPCNCRHSFHKWCDPCTFHGQGSKRACHSHPNRPSNNPMIVCICRCSILLKMMAVEKEAETAMDLVMDLAEEMDLVLEMFPYR